MHSLPFVTPNSYFQICCFSRKLASIQQKEIRLKDIVKWLCNCTCKYVQNIFVCRSNEHEIEFCYKNSNNFSSLIFLHHFISKSMIFSAIIIIIIIIMGYLWQCKKNVFVIQFLFRWIQNINFNNSFDS